MIHFIGSGSQLTRNTRLAWLQEQCVSGKHTTLRLLSCALPCIGYSDSHSYVSSRETDQCDLNGSLEPDILEKLGPELQPEL